MFPNKPQIADLTSPEAIQSAIDKLQLTPRPLIILLGNFDEHLNPQVRSICSRIIAPIAIDPGALILDDGSGSGCAALMGEAAAEQDQMPSLLGLISNEAAESALDSNHGLFLRLPKEWSYSAKYTFQIADQLTKQGTTEAQPVSAVLFGGGDAEKKAIVRCARRSWPVVVIQGTGGLADQILDVSAPCNGAAPPALDPDLREIVDTATLFRFRLDGNFEDLRRILLGRVDLRKDALADTLNEAWAIYDQLDEAANGKQTAFRRVEWTILGLAVAATFFAILQSGKSVPHWFTVPAHSAGVHWFVLIIPITASVIAAYNSHFREGYKWILLRGAAEAVKREIFRFRTRAGPYSDEQCIQNSRESKLAAKIKDITSALEQSEVNKTNIDAKVKSDPARLQFLAPEEYRQTRIEDQVNYFVGKTRKLSKKLRFLQVSVYVAGATGTLLAAINFDVWVALATSIVTALTTKLQADQVENSLMKYNQALTSLRNVDIWWKALSKWEKGRRTNIDLLVDQAEKALEGETAGWIQQMQSALDKLTEKEQPASGGQQHSTTGTHGLSAGAGA